MSTTTAKKHLNHMTHFEEIEAFISLQSDLTPAKRAKAREACLRAVQGHPLSLPGIPEDVFQALRRMVNEAAYKIRVSGQVCNPDPGALQQIAREAYEAGLRSSQQEQAWTVAETAAFLGTSKAVVYVLAGSGAIPCRRVGREYRFEPSAVREWLAGKNHGK